MLRSYTYLVESGCQVHLGEVSRTSKPIEHSIRTQQGCVVSLRQPVQSPIGHHDAQLAFFLHRKQWCPIRGFASTELPIPEILNDIFPHGRQFSSWKLLIQRRKRWFLICLCFHGMVSSPYWGKSRWKAQLWRLHRTGRRYLPIPCHDSSFHVCTTGSYKSKVWLWKLSFLSLLLLRDLLTIRDDTTKLSIKSLEIDRSYRPTRTFGLT